MVKITDELIKKLAHLSRLHIEDNEIDEYKKDFASMVQFVEKLNEVDTTGIAPLLHITDAVNVLREDDVQGSCTQEQALKNAPKTDGIYFLVPKVIKK